MTFKESIIRYRETDLELGRVGTGTLMSQKLDVRVHDWTMQQEQCTTSSQPGNVSEIAKKEVTCS